MQPGRLTCRAGCLHVLATLFPALVSLVACAKVFARFAAEECRRGCIPSAEKKSAVQPASAQVYYSGV